MTSCLMLRAAFMPFVSVEPSAATWTVSSCLICIVAPNLVTPIARSFEAYGGEHRLTAQIDSTYLMRGCSPEGAFHLEDQWAFVLTMARDAARTFATAV